jgi:hypothetical protein
MTADTRSTPLTAGEARDAVQKVATRIDDWFRYQVTQALLSHLDYRKITTYQGRELGNALGASLYTAAGTDMSQTADRQATMTIPDPAVDPAGLRIPSAFYWRHR